MTTLRSLTAVAVLGGWLISSATAQDAPALYGVSHVTNDSSAKATVYYKWGKGDWNKVVIEKGKTKSFPYEYKGTSKTSPDLYITIDVDTDGVKYVEHVLSRGAAPDDNTLKYGHQFTIKQLKGTDTRYIDNVTTGATVKITNKDSSKPEVK